jgi:hypothetical protein
MTTILAAPPVMFPSTIASASTPSSPSPSQPAQPRPYTSQAQITPPNSGDSLEASFSPVSPKNTWSLPPHLQAQSGQLRPRKVPMYVPAVLRPTEKPTRQSPPKTNPLSFGLESPGLDGPAGLGECFVPVGVSRVVTEEWNEELLGPVTGPPTRNHWMVSLPLSHTPSLFHIWSREHFTGHSSRAERRFLAAVLSLDTWR